MEINVIHATEDFLKSEIEKRNERITQLEEHVQRITQRDYSTAGALQAMRDGRGTCTTYNTT